MSSITLQDITMQVPYNGDVVGHQTAGQGSIFLYPEGNLLSHQMYAGRAVHPSCLETTPVESHHLVVRVTGSSAKTSMIDTCWMIAICLSERPHGRQMRGSPYGATFTNNNRPHRDVLRKTMRTGLETQVRQTRPGKALPIGPTTTR
jgi:hypothetical protein